MNAIEFYFKSKIPHAFNQLSVACDIEKTIPGFNFKELKKTLEGEETLATSEWGKMEIIVIKDRVRLNPAVQEHQQLKQVFNTLDVVRVILVVGKSKFHVPSHLSLEKLIEAMEAASGYIQKQSVTTQE